MASGQLLLYEKGQRNMIGLIFLLIVAPCITGSFVCSLTDTSLKHNRIYGYIAGFISNLAIWTVMTLIYLFVFPYGAFHRLRYAYIGVMIALCLIRLILIIIQKKDLRRKLSDVYSHLKDYFFNSADRLYIVIFTVIAILQIFSIMYYAPSEYVQDDYYYNSAVNDTVYMDQLYTKKSKSGVFPEDPYATPPYVNSGYKMFLCPWIAFLALLAATSHIHSLIICHTLIPGFIIVLIYLTQFVFASFFYRNDSHRIRIFMMWSSVLAFAFCYTYYLFHLGFQIATWGKVSAAFTGLPMLLLATLDTIDATLSASVTLRRLAGNFLFLFLMGAGTAAMAASVMMVGSAGLFFLMTACLIKYRKKEVLIYSFAAELMILIQLALWLIVIR